MSYFAVKKTNGRLSTRILVYDRFSNFIRFRVTERSTENTISGLYFNEECDYFEENTSDNQVFRYTILQPFQFEPELKKNVRKGFYKKIVLKHFTIFTGKRLCWSLFLMNFQSFGTYFEEHLRTAASETCGNKSHEKEKKHIHARFRCGFTKYQNSTSPLVQMWTLQKRSERSRLYLWHRSGCNAYCFI